MIVLAQSQFVTVIVVVEQGSQVAEGFQVLFRVFLGNQQHKNQIYRTTVNGVEIDGGRQFQQQPDGLLAVTKTAVRNGDAFTDARGAQLFPGYQGIEDLLFVEAVAAGRGQLRNLVQQLFLAAGLHLAMGACFGE